MSAPVVATARGKVRGTVEDGIARFLGIPFAAPPFGPDRFGLPRPHEPWEGEFVASTFGPTPPQTPYTGRIGELLPGRLIEGDEILNLNVWTPTSALEGGKLPVMVWIYGGALTRGSNAWPLYSGTPFVRDGVVFVAINYRVGVEGFAILEGAPNNRGLADVVAALEWIRDEIARFGGDPDDVTVFGQSAGGGLVSMALASPRTEGLIRKAIIMSAVMGPTPPRPEKHLAHHLAEMLGVPPTREAFAAIPPAELVQAQARLLSGGNAVSGGLNYFFVPGDDLLPENPWSLLQAPKAMAVPVLIGTTAEEHRFWFAPSITGGDPPSEWIEGALAAYGVSDETFELYRRNRPDDSETVAFGALLMDYICRVGLNLYADNRSAAGARTWAYEFAWKSPVMDLGAAHCVDLPFLFDNLVDDAPRRLIGDAAPQPLADEVHGAFVRFARTGDPGWEAWNEQRPVMTFDSPQSAVVCAPREDERVALARASLFQPAPA